MARCAECAFVNDAGSILCVRCGANLSALADRGERRQITVLFCDLVGSTKLSAELDPEDYRELVSTYQAEARQVFEKFGGRVAQYLGDGVLVYFGHPQAHEDDPARAVHAGIAMVAALAGVDFSKWTEAPVSGRVGIHTGVVVVAPVGEGDSRQVLALGEAPNIAARLQSLAKPNGVVISEATRSLLGQAFELRSMGVHELKGTRPMQVFEVKSEPTFASRRFGPAALTPLIGRETERTALMAEWRSSQIGIGRVVTLQGEPGIGKSRLVAWLRANLKNEPHTVVECQCLPYFSQTSLYPLVSGVRRLLIDSQSHDGRDMSLGGSADVAAVAAFLGIAVDGTTLLPPLQQKERTYEALTSLLRQLAKHRAVLLLLEDAHWADPSSLEFLEEFVSRSIPQHLMVLITLRPPQRLPQVIEATAKDLRLGPLRSDEVATIVAHIASGKRLPEPVVTTVLATTGGTPLFVEELTRTLLASGALVEGAKSYELSGSIDRLTVPATLRDLLTERLDALGESRSVAQAAAVLGRDFSDAVLAKIVDRTPEELDRAVRILESAGLVERDEAGTGHRFRHALIQEAAYDTLLRPVRREYHGRIAMALEEGFPQVVEARPEIVARHFTEALAPKRACPYWRKAGERAVARFANAEAVAFYRAALESLNAEPASDLRDRDELSMLMALGPALIATQSYASTQVAQCYERARQICEGQGERRELLPILFGLVGFYLTSGELGVGAEVAQRLLGLAERAQDPGNVEALFAVGMSQFYLGRLSAARATLSHAVDVHAPRYDKSLGNLYLVDPGSGCRRALALTLWLLGEHDAAQVVSAESVRLAEQQGNPYGLAAALVFAATLQQFRQDRMAVKELSERAISISSDRGFSYWRPWATVLRAWVDAVNGVVKAQEVRDVGDDYEKTGARIILPFYYALAAHAYLEQGDLEQGLAATTAALETIRKTGERWWEAEVWRIRGQLEFDAGAIDEARASRLRAVAVARELGAASLARRAANALGQDARADGTDT